MSKRLTTALIALLTFAAVLVVVPLASPAAAHEQTRTVKRCAYDPFAGNQCWNETVSVAHSHDPPTQEDLEGKPCPAGTTGTPPNCLPIPSDNSNNAGSQNNDGDGPDTTEDPDENGPDTTEDPDENGPDTTEDPDENEPDTTEDPDENGPDTTEDPDENGPDTTEDPDENEPDTTEDPDENGPDTTEDPDENGPDTTEDPDGDEPTTPTNPCEPWPACQSVSDRQPTTTTTTSTDPCGDYADELVDALSKAGHGAAYNPPTKPDGCDGPSASEMVGSVDNFFKRLLAWWGSEEQKRSEFSREVSRAHIENLQRLWNAIPEDERETLIDTGITVGLGSACLALIGAEETASLTPGAQSASAHLSAAAVTVCASAGLKILDEILGDDDGGQAGKSLHQSGTDDPPADPNEPDNTDYTYDGGAHARRMCAEYAIAYFCDLVKANEQEGGQ